MELALVRLPLPVVMINYPPDGSLADSVIWDVQHAVHLSLNQMYVEGHRRILFVGDTRTQRGFRLRWQAFLDACQRLGLPMSPDEHVTGPPGTGTDWLNSLTTKLAEGGYTAVLCALNRDVTWAAVALERAGLTVPGHVSLIGTDHEAHPAYPGLTRPVLLVREAAERAAELMLRRIGSPLLPFEHVRLRGGAFFRGETLGPPPRESRQQAGGREG
ncbi:substrate-binding domain-containing protein [Paenibacillus sp. CC-CFT747]|nr:substrate-binding domain-containing protein [Paenibacillus sp. CC-CFT747]